MKKLLMTALVIILGTLSINAQTLTSAEVKGQISNQLTELYKKQTNADVEVKITAVQFAQLQLPDGKVSYKITQGGDRIIPRDIKRVEIYVNNIFVRSLNIPVQTSVYKDVLVASDFIDRDQAISSETVEVKRIDVSNKIDYVLTNQVLGKDISSKKAFQKGEIIDKRFVKLRPDVIRNGNVRVFFVSNGSVMISIDGTALSDGMAGDYISVENRNYKKVYTGKVIGENRVLVNI